MTTTIDLETDFYTKAVFAYLEKRKEFPRLVKQSEAGSFNLFFTDQIRLFQSQRF